MSKRITIRFLVKDFPILTAYIIYKWYAFFDNNKRLVMKETPCLALLEKKNHILYYSLLYMPQLEPILNI